MRRLGLSLALLLPSALWAGGAGAQPVSGGPDSADPVQRGEYVFQASGCLGCHTKDDKPESRLAGGRALKTPFGTFHTPNITPDREHGIGGWSDADFIRAFREGKRPDGQSLFPAFPYVAYTKMTDRDLLDLKAYLFAQAPSPAPNRPHELSAPFGWRFLLPAWQFLYLEEGAVPDDPAKPPAWNRGRYLVDAMGHCGECHTPRGQLGGLDSGRYLAGNPEGVEGDKVPAIHGGPEHGLGDWSEGDITLLLELGMTPDGDFVGGSMGEVVRNSTSKLTKEDRAAIAAYLKSVPAPK